MTELVGVEKKRRGGLGVSDGMEQKEGKVSSTFLPSFLAFLLPPPSSLLSIAGEGGTSHADYSTSALKLLPSYERAPSGGGVLEQVSVGVEEDESVSSSPFLRRRSWLEEEKCRLATELTRERQI